MYVKETVLMATKQIKLPSKDGVHQLHVVIWEPDTEVKAILQISHGMVEFIERYGDFANYLNEKGILVVGNDHLGHGHTAEKDEDLGYFCPENMSATVVDDLHEVTTYIKGKYPNIPYILLGHSMGSFMARRYIMTYGSELTGAIISGTGSQPGAVLAGGKMVAGLIGAVKGERYRSPLLKSMAFGAYNKKIDNPRTVSDWLSKDEKIVDIYENDKFCKYDFTVDGYKTLFDSISFIQKPENIKKIPVDLPIFFISGTDDPVGNYGKGVEQVYDAYEAAGVKDIEIVLYHDGRHEMLNEIEREGVYEDVDTWIKRHI